MKEKFQIDNKTIKIDASNLYYRDLNKLLKEIMQNYNLKKIQLYNVYGQRYIGTGLRKEIEIEIYGTPGQDLGAFMDGPKIKVFGNAQDGCGNTLNSGEIIIYGNAGDILGMSARGGEIYVRGNVGYRCVIHMKEYNDKKPVVVIGGTAQDFFGEYLAGGVVILLGLNLKEDEIHKANFIGTGMHGGVIYIRGGFEKTQVSKEVGIFELQDSDFIMIEKYIRKFSEYFNYSDAEIFSRKFLKLLPISSRPYGKLYAY
jgi:glutamate synthase domain-containing protein 3